MKKGMSLVYFTVVIVVIIILSGITLTGLVGADSTIENAKEVTFKYDVTALNEELELNVLDAEVNGKVLDRADINLNTIDEIRTYIPSFPEKYENMFKVKEGKIVFYGTEEKTKEWIEDLAYIDIEE